VSTANILAIAVGNSRTRLGPFKDGGLHHPRALPNDDASALLAAALEALEAEGPGDSGEPAIVVTASVNDRLAEQLERELEGRADHVVRVGRDVPIPLVHSLDDPRTLGHDRALCALAAYSRAQQACIVIDVGTATTIDFVDGEGTFHGGVIAPGPRLLLRALHEHTAALPDLAFGPAETSDTPFGKTTRDAMLKGARESVIGLVHHCINRYAEFYDAYPQVVATGGDAAALFENDELVEHIVPDLQLMGIHAAWLHFLASGDGDA